MRPVSAFLAVQLSNFRVKDRTKNGFPMKRAQSAVRAVVRVFLLGQYKV